MKGIIPAIIGVIICLMACNEPAQQSPPQTIPQAASILAYTRVVVRDSSGVVAGSFDRTRVSLSFPDLLDTSGSARKMDESIHHHILELIHSATSEEPDSIRKMPVSIANAAHGFIEDYLRTANEFGETIPWYLDVDIDTTYIGPRLVSFSLNSDVFTGGAHGYSGAYGLHFDPQTGEKVDPLSFFADTDSLSSALERNFRRARKLPANSSLIDGGLFDDYSKAFPLPVEMFFTDTGFAAVYNPYDIASYAEGRIVIELSNAEVLPLLKGGIKP